MHFISLQCHGSDMLAFQSSPLSRQGQMSMLVETLLCCLGRTRTCGCLQNQNLTCRQLHHEASRLLGLHYIIYGYATYDASSICSPESLCLCKSIIKFYTMQTFKGKILVFVIFHRHSAICLEHFGYFV